MLLLVSLTAIALVAAAVATAADRPDIRTVAVSRDRAGTLVFAIRFAGIPDQNDTSLTVPGSFPWVPIVLAVLGIGALLGIGGWTYDRIRQSAPPKRPLGAW